ncbi:hypothetical protein XU18_3955 [Perkinsela sp. CCAP 1560/4]|nr:hypothetical protein XU18_3955 [Perkinsela sp. CCAP 1560/4]|eukprot:KNH04897.1 hypothetical protein XU18_3955 [Perkinsela sp. CCAP 1560/4]
MHDERSDDSYSDVIDRISGVIQNSLKGESGGDNAATSGCTSEFTYPRIILINGPAGCGKTHILRAAVRLVAKRMYGDGTDERLLQQVESLDIFRGCFPWTSGSRIDHTKEENAKVYLLESIDAVLDAESDARIVQSNTCNKTSIHQDGNSAPRPILGDAELDGETYVLLRLVSALNSFAYHSGCLVFTARDITRIHPWIRSKLHRVLTIPVLEGVAIDNMFIQLLTEKIKPTRGKGHPITAGGALKAIRDHATSFVAFLEESKPNFTGRASCGLIKHLAWTLLNALAYQLASGNSHERNSALLRKLKDTKCSSEMGIDAREVRQIPNVRWGDIVGHSEAQKVLHELIRASLRTGHFSPHEIQPACGSASPDIDKHILFYGLPGTGKTMLAKATAAAFGASFLELRLADIVCAPVGAPEARLSALFRSARKCLPSIIFIDEIECFLSRHIEAGNATVQALTELFFLEIDQVNFHQEPICIIAATNAPHRVDRRLLQNGRIGRAIHVLPPMVDEIMVYCENRSSHGISQDGIAKVIDCVSEHFQNAAEKDTDACLGMPFLKGFTGYTLPDIDSLLSTIHSIDTYGEFMEQSSGTANTDKPSVNETPMRVTRREIIQRAMETAPPSFTPGSLRLLVQWEKDTSM